MRRLFVTAALGAVLLGGAACGSDNPEPGASGPAATATGNTNAVCDEVRKITGDQAKIVVDALGEMALAQGKDDAAGIRAAEQKIATALRDWGAKVSTQAQNANDPKVRQDLNELSKAATDLAGKEKPSLQDVDAVRQKAEQACG